MSNKVSIITGASRGIGRAIATELAFSGFIVVINYKNNKLLAENLAREIISQGGLAYAVQADISNLHESNSLIETAEKFGNIEVLINNASISLCKIFQDVTSEECKNIFNTNVYGTINCSIAAIKKMLYKKRGKIVNISSIWGIHGASMEVHYSASKAAIIGFTKALAKELGPSNIQVNCVAPGIIETDMNSELDSKTLQNLARKTPLGRIGLPLDIAKIVKFLVSPDSNFITGQVIVADGGFDS
ncbi:MAG: 3-oxoacyl-ACP reductase FabG [Oscillospiraceae bacterium]|jgi:3-oxoacyl-[acyl-carrier protein] reductase|nr:3-oxoacyl-ACP reductase FabG [Oscillospiraceae bacterium]